MIEAFNKLLKPLEWQIEKIACEHDPNNFYLLKTIPGVGQIPALVILYEVHGIKRFASVQRFCSYSRLIRPEKQSDGKWEGKSNKKIGNAHLKWAIKTAAMISLHESEQAKKYVERLNHKHNKGKAPGIYTHKLGRAIYFMLKNKKAFDMKLFFSRFKVACNYSFAICFNDYCPYFSTRNNQDQKPVGFLKFLSRKLPSMLFAISTNLLVGIENKIISSGTKFLAIVSISPIIHFGFS